MKLVALGANLSSQYGTPAQTLYAALKAMAEKGIWPAQISRVWKTAPVPFVEGQPWYFNAVTLVETALDPKNLIKTLLSIEHDFGRVRTERNAPRLLDLDLIAYDEKIIDNPPDFIVPHPRMQERAFVLLPMADIVEDWIHPQSGVHLKQLIELLPSGQEAVAMEDGWNE